MGFQESLAAGKFVVTSEIGPPKGTHIQEMMADAEMLRGRVDAINVTDLQSSVMRLGSLAVCHLLQEKGLEPILQVTCRDRNRLALQADLLSASILGIRNVLALTGDYASLGDHPQAKPVFDLDSVSLLGVIKKLENGTDMVGNSLLGAPRFFPGAVVNPGGNPVEAQVLKMEKKIKAGANFFQTQAVYDVGAFEKFMKRVTPFKVPVLAGIILLKSAGMARFMNKNVAGVFVPEPFIQRMAKAEDRVKTSIEIGAELIRDLKGMCQGVHIMPIGWESKVPALLDAAKL
ncbi:MAG: methylenetetrahydrofolate reductase [Syntrophaceae bacterium]|jgi:5,10-methylenetetrahydrofolate reductase|nr:methylenetetrahydrofolate reductase [Syntrophaceae bacterium]